MKDNIQKGPILVLLTTILRFICPIFSYTTCVVTDITRGAADRMHGVMDIQCREVKHFACTTSSFLFWTFQKGKNTAFSKSDLVSKKN